MPQSKATSMSSSYGTRAQSRQAGKTATAGARSSTRIATPSKANNQLPTPFSTPTRVRSGTPSSIQSAGRGSTRTKTKRQNEDHELRVDTPSRPSKRRKIATDDYNDLLTGKVKPSHILNVVQLQTPEATPAPSKAGSDTADLDEQSLEEVATPTKSKTANRVKDIRAESGKRKMKVRDSDPSAEILSNDAEMAQPHCEHLQPSCEPNVNPERSAIPLPLQDAQPKERAFAPKLVHAILDSAIATLRSRTQPVLHAKSATDAGANSAQRLVSQPYLPGMDHAAEKDVRAVLERTVTEAEGNCVLLVGPRQVGKTAVCFHLIDFLEMPGLT